MSIAKTNILSRLNQNAQTSSKEVLRPKTTMTAKQALLSEAQLNTLISQKMRENHIEVHWVDQNNWQNTFAQLAKMKNIRHCLLGNRLDYQESAHRALVDNIPEIKITRFDQPYENLRTTLFQEIDASLTLAHGAIADTGTLLVIPDAREPRMMSLVPPIHFIKLSAKDIVKDFESLIEDAPWTSREKIPSNILLISSPSKTADIQQTLAYGAHGPKEVIVLIEQ